MALAFRNNALVRFAAGLAAKCLCCVPPKCNTGTDECGNAVQECGPLGPTSIGECTPECVPPPEPCECGPDSPCPECYECIDRKCVRIEDCCKDGTPCPECQECINGVCQPCGDCEKCEGGRCQPCGPCEVCIDGVCVPCPELCIGGICFPRQYYCCYDSPESTGGGPRTTTCRQATLAAFGQTNPCEHGAKSGPHNSSLLCQQACSRFKCVPDACGNNQCVPDPNGTYENYQACAQACGDPCDMPCAFEGANAPGIYSIDGCQRQICVSYCSTNSRPIRVQIWGPIMVNGCPQPGTRIIKTDSDWRGDVCCDCPNDRNGGSLQGGPKGQITWNKPRGAISFEVAVLTACGAEYTIDVQGCESCAEQDDPEPCDCEDDGDCAEDCFCCDGICQTEPCNPCSGPCDSSCYAAYCCDTGGGCGPNGDGCAEFLGCAERWNSPAYFATSNEAKEFADEFNANNPNTSDGCAMMFFATNQHCPKNVQASPCPEGCACVDGQCVVPCSVSGCPDPATPCCGEGYVNPNDLESFPSPECWGPPPLVVYFCEGFGWVGGTPEQALAACEAECETECVFVAVSCGGL